MASLFRLGFQNFVKSLPIIVPQRGISVTPICRLKEISETRNGKELIIEGVYVKSDRVDKLVKPVIPENFGDRKPCYLCALDLDLKHTDILILNQFVRSDGCALPARITGLCARQQKRVATLIAMAQKAGLMINQKVTNYTQHIRKRKDDKKFNTYFDEKTIFGPREPRQRDKFKR